MASAFETGGPAPAGAGWGWIVAYGVVSLLLGLFAFAQPLVATLAAVAVIGAFFVAAGIMAIVAGASGRGYEGRGYTIAFGVLSLVVGVVMLTSPASGALSLTMLVAVWLAARGVLELVLGFRFRRHRGWMLALGAINLLLALYVLATLPWSALTLPGFVLGVSFLMAGITATISGLSHKRGAPAFAVPG